MVVVIDDDREVRTLIELALARSGRTIVGFADGQEALDFLRANGGEVDLVLSDVVMEGFDAHRLMRHLRAQQATAATPVIFLTPYGRDDERAPAADDAFVERLATPFEVGRLREQAEAAMARPRAHAPARDPDTGFHTKARFEALLEEALRSAPADSSLAVTAGIVAGPAGEELLACIARVVGAQLRTGDAAGRWAERVLVLVHPRCGAEGANAIATRIAAALRSDPACAGTELKLGIAIAAEPGAASADDLIRAAQEASRSATPDGPLPIIVRTVGTGTR